MKVVVDINALPCKNGKDCTECAFYSTVDICEMTTALRSFPKYKERPHGEWICEGAMADYTNVLVFRCSVCEEHFVGHVEDKKSQNFCPNCGADMRKEGDSDA